MRSALAGASRADKIEKIKKWKTKQNAQNVEVTKNPGIKYAGNAQKKKKKKTPVKYVE